MDKCPFFGKCGGCKYDFTSLDYQKNKESELSKIENLSSPIWCPFGVRTRADFCFSPNAFGFFTKSSKDIIKITHCINLDDEINKIIPELAKLPWGCNGSCLVTKCDNGIDVCINATVDYVSSEFKSSVLKLPILRMAWNGKKVLCNAVPMVRFGENLIEYQSGAFMQPVDSKYSWLREMVVQNAFGRVADLFCGLGNFTFDLDADGFDIVGNGIKRDLFKHPLTLAMLSKYDCVVMDPPRSGALEQTKVLAKSDVKKIIYISCNPNTFIRDSKILCAGGYTISKIIPIDQFVGSSHWELFSVFEK